MNHEDEGVDVCVSWGGGLLDGEWEDLLGEGWIIRIIVILFCCILNHLALVN